MKAFMLFGGSGPLVILTSHASIEAPELLEKLAAKGVDKFLAYELPLASAKDRYGMHFDIVAHSLAETDDLRLLDYDGTHALRLFSFSEMAGPTVHEPATVSPLASVAGV
jgi:hypothetical protein